MELVQVATCTGPKSVHVATCTSLLVQVATCTSCLYKLQLVHEICTRGVAVAGHDLQVDDEGLVQDHTYTV